MLMRFGREFSSPSEVNMFSDIMLVLWAIAVVICANGEHIFDYFFARK